MITNEYIIGAWLDAIDRAKEEDFVPLKEEDARPDEAWQESELWMECFVDPEASPYHKSSQAEHSLHLASGDTFDLLRHSYRYEDLELIVTESANMIQIVAHKPGTNPLEVSDKKAFLDETASTILRAENSDKIWTFQYPDQIDEGTIISSDASANLYTLASWRDRVDMVIRNDRIHLLCYKRTAGRIGFRNDQDWFEEAFTKRRSIGSDRDEALDGGSIPETSS